MKKYLLLFSILFFFYTSNLQSQWIRLGGLAGNNVQNVIKFNNKLFANLNLGGLYVSTDNGVTWDNITQVNTGNGWALGSSGNNIFAGFIGAGIYTSTDVGITWTQTLVGETTVWFLIANNKIYAAATGNPGGVYVSTDNGLGWARINFSFSEKPTCLAQVGNNMFAGCFNGKLYASTDNGATWALSNNGIPSGKVESIISLGTKILASVYGWGVFISTDNGSTWVNPSGNSTYINSFFVNGTNVIAGSGSDMGVSISYNGGISWFYSNTGLTNKYVNYITLIGTDVYACTADGIFKRPLQELLLNAPAATPATSIGSTIFTSNWNTASNATGYYLDVATDNSFTNFVTGYNNKDLLNVTTYSVTGLTANTTYYYRVRGYNSGGTSSNSNTVSVTTLPNAPSAPIATSASALGQTSFTSNWNAASNAAGYYLDVATDNAFTNFVTGYNNKDLLNVTTYSVTGLTANTTYYYRVRGYNSGGTSSNSNTITFTTLPNAPSALIATSATTIGQTSFNANWNAASNATGYYLDVATNNSFSNFVSGYNNRDVLNVTSFPISGLTPNTAHYYRVRAYNTGGTSGNSNVISVTLVGIENKDGIPTEFLLEQNYPNPFNPSTIISYKLPVSSFVSLKVYNCLGNEVEMLVNEYQQAGQYVKTFYGTSLPSGVYFYKLTAGNFVNTKKLILIK